jgi:hypothetical protein
VARCGVHLAVLALLAALAVAYTWPLARHLGTHYAVRSADPAGLSADLLLESWILASDVRRLVRDPLRIFETNNFHPFRHTLAFSENLIGVAVLVLPVGLLWDNPTLTHNVALLLCLAITGWGAFLLVRELTGSALAGLLTGALVVYSPAVLAQVVLVFLLASLWTPIALFLVVRLLRRPSWRTSGLLGTAVALQTWSSLHHGVFLGLGLAATAGTLLVVSSSARRAFPQLALAGVLAGILSLPVLLPYQAVRREMDLERREGALRFSLRPETIVPPLRRPVAYLVARLRSGERVPSFAPLVPWVLIGAGAVAAGFARRRLGLDWRPLAGLAAGGLATFLFALGPVPHPWLPTPYGPLSTLMPGLGWLRVPARAVAYSHLILCVLAGCALAVVLRCLPRPAQRATVVTGVLALVVLEGGWRPIPLAPAPGRTSALGAAIDRLEPGCAIAELPVTIPSMGVALFRSTAHWRPLVNGYSGFDPIGLLAMQAFLNPFPSPRSLAFLHAAGACAVVVRGGMGPVARERILAASRALGLGVEEADSELLIHLPPPPAPPAEAEPLSRGGWRIAPEAGPAGPAVLDGDLDTVWWGSLREETGPVELTVDLGAVETVSGVGLELGRHFRMSLRTYRVEGSVDGREWTTLAEDPLAVPPLASYRANHLRVCQRIDFPQASVRWLRIRPYRRPPPRGAPDTAWARWGVAELGVYGEPEAARQTRPTPEGR